MNKRRLLLTVLLGLGFGACAATAADQSPTAVLDSRWATSLEPTVDLEKGWRDPPEVSRVRCWWWWLNGNVTKEAITRDLEEMKAKGLGGANIIDAGGADQRGNRQVPHGPDFASTAWRELFVHAVKEADRLGLELGLNVQSGWNLGGPTVRPEQAAKKLTWAETTIAGGSPVDLKLPQPPIVDDFYRDVATLAVRVGADANASNGFEVSAESSQANHPPALAVDGDPKTFWVSGTYEPGDGPSLERRSDSNSNSRLRRRFRRSSFTRATITARSGAGSKAPPVRTIGTSWAAGRQTPAARRLSIFRGPPPGDSAW